MLIFFAKKRAALFTKSPSEEFVTMQYAAFFRACNDETSTGNGHIWFRHWDLGGWGFHKGDFDYSTLMPCNQRLHKPISSSKFLPKFWVFLRISAKIIPQKARNHDIRDKKARECDICDKKEKKHPPAVTKCNVKTQNDPRGPKSDPKWPQMT